MSALDGRSGFLRSLISLPLIGGGVTLIGRPAAPVPIVGLTGDWNLLQVIIILVMMIGISSFLSPAFLSVHNFTNISRQISITTILAFGETLLIIGGMLDLSCGSVMALAGLMAVLVYKATGVGAIAIGYPEQPVADPRQPVAVSDLLVRK